MTLPVTIHVPWDDTQSIYRMVIGVRNTNSVPKGEERAVLQFAAVSGRPEAEQPTADLYSNLSGRNRVELKDMTADEFIRHVTENGPGIIQLTPNQFARRYRD